MRALVVDNSQATRAVLSKILLSLSPLIKVTEAENGKQALRAMTKEMFDLIITDLEMEGGSGAVFIKHLQDSRLLKNKPIIIYTSTPYFEETADNIVVVSKTLTPMAELSTIIKELIFKYKICPKCPEAINGTTCNNICFYHHLDNKWQDKIKTHLK